MQTSLNSVEICAGGGGMALGIEQAGFKHVAVFDNDKYAYATLLQNRSNWNPALEDIRELNGSKYEGVDLFAGGVPCPPFSIAGEQKGSDDARDLFPEALRLIRQIQPRAVILENVRGFSSARFETYRRSLINELQQIGLLAQWRVINASDFGIAQLRPRFILVALRPEYVPYFVWPEPLGRYITVAQAIGDLMRAGEWPGADAWMTKANAIAPTLVGGSKKHGGADLGPTRAKKKWAELGIDGKGIADAPPSRLDPADKLPRLTIPMVARLQGFPDSWAFQGGKPAQYRQIGNALPPLVAQHVGNAVGQAIRQDTCKTRHPKQLELLNA